MGLDAQALLWAVSLRMAGVVAGRNDKRPAGRLVPRAAGVAVRG
ncbi:hypothetical protein [Pseudomonas yamanorum]|nr:hypothetical protein [Pseudomonas yamanorum]